MSITQLTFNSYSDIQVALSNNIDVRLKMAQMQSLFPEHLEKLPQTVILSRLFQLIKMSASSTPHMASIDQVATSYNTLRLRTIQVLKEDLLNQVIESLKCHQLAMAKYQEGAKAEAAAEMAKTVQIAEKMKASYKTLADGFDQFEREVEKILIECHEPSGRHLVQSFWKAHTAALNIKHLFLRSEADTQQLSWTGQDLSDLDSISFYEKEGPHDFMNFIKSVVDADFFKPEAPEFKGMKTGFNLTMQPQVNRFVQALQNTPQGLLNRFEESFLQWLAVADKNYTVQLAFETDI